jgi:hypothetical protein
MLGRCEIHVAAMRALALASYIPIATGPVPVNPIRSVKLRHNVPLFLFSRPVAVIC